MIRCAWLPRCVRSRRARWCGHGWALAQQVLALLLGLASVAVVAGLAVLTLAVVGVVLAGCAVALLVLAGLMVVDGVMAEGQR
jgi:hypothetical protein